MTPTKNPEAGNLGAEDDDAASEIDMSMIPPGTDLTTIITLDDAERLTEQILVHLAMIADSAEEVVSLIEQAKNGHAHEVLGYRSWTEYVAERFGGTLARISKAERVPIVELLSGQGMSTRAIATVVGVSKDTVSRDLRAGVSDETPAEPIAAADPAGFFTDEAEMRDAFVMADATPDEFEAAITEARADDDMSRENVIARVTAIKKITGIDGKTYPAKKAEPRTVRRRPLSDRVREIAHDFERVVNRLSNVAEDDRYPASKPAIAGVLLPHLKRVHQVTNGLLDKLPADDRDYRLSLMSATNDLRLAMDRIQRLHEDDRRGTAFGMNEGETDHLRQSLVRQLLRAEPIVSGWS